VELTWITDWNKLIPIRSEWNRLVSEAHTNTIFQTFEWHQSCWESFGESSKLQVLLVFEDKKLIGVAPLLQIKQTVNLIPERVICFIGSHNNPSDYNDFIVPSNRQDVLLAILAEIVKSLDLWSILDFKHIPSHSCHVDTIQSFFNDCHYHTYAYPWIKAPTRQLGIDPADDHKVANKKSLRRKLNGLKKMGNLEFRYNEDLDTILNSLDNFFQQHIERRNLTNAPSLFCDPKQKLFYRKMIETLYPTGWLRFSTVLLDDEAIAFHCGFEFDKRFIWYKPTFSVKHIKQSPGEVLIKFLLDEAISLELDEFDFTIGSEAFKFRFANLIRTNHRILVFRRPFSFYIFKLKIIKGQIKPMIKKFIRHKS